MANQSLTFYTDATHTQKYAVPYIGDITNMSSVNPGMVGLASSTNNLLQTIQFGETFEAGRRNVNFLIQQGNFCIYSSATMVYGIRAWIDGDRAKVANKDYSGFGLRASEMTAGITLALATISGRVRLGLVVWGTAYQGINRAIFCTAYDLDLVYDTIKKTGDPFNPYSGGGYTEPGGGEVTNYDDTSDSVTDDGLPTIGATNSGMISLFCPSSIEVQNLADLLFSYNFFDWLQKNLQNIEELVVMFGMVPFSITGAGTANVTFLGFDVSQLSHPVYLTKCPDQYFEFDMGSVSFDGNDSRIHTTDSVFDYSPFSSLGIYLPFIGYQELDIDEVRNTTISLKYKVDVLSGACVAIIRLTDEMGTRDVYQFSGNCLTQLPLGSSDISGIVQGVISVATAAAGAGTAGAVASAGEAVTAEKEAAGKLSEAGANLQNKQRAASVSNANSGLASATANGMMGMKPNYKHSGAIGSASSMLAVKQPYLYLKTPNEAVPEGYEKYCGFPANITTRLGSISGYAVVEDIRLNGLVATSPEVEEIYQLLKSGIII